MECTNTTKQSRPALNCIEQLIWPHTAPLRGKEAYSTTPVMAIYHSTTLQVRKWNLLPSYVVLGSFGYEAYPFQDVCYVIDASLLNAECFSCFV